LFRPYWKVIGFSVIKDIINKPQKAQQLADLTEQSVRQLLILTQAHTLPHLVLTKRRDVVEKIAQARKASVAEVLTQPRSNLAKILALLLSQPVADVETSVMETLVAIEPAIRESSNNKLESLVALDITGVAIEILMLAADEDEPKKKPVGRASIVARTTANGFSTTAPLASLQRLLRLKVDSAQRLPKRKAWIPFAKLKFWVSSRTSQTSSRAL
jgi:serine/threonine-protein kinase ATR